jgi:peptide/nickel transport system permease protein
VRHIIVLLAITRSRPEPFMLAFAIRRLAEALLVMVTVAMLAFVLFRFVGDPINQMVGQDTTLEDRERLRQDLGLNDPYIVQFARFVGRAATFDFGVSYQVKQPVTKLISDRFPATLELALAAAFFALIIGIPMGVYTGIHRDSFISKAFLTISLVGISLPTFLIGILLIYIFAVTLGWLPSFGRGETVVIAGWRTGLLSWSGWKAIILPAITLGLFQMTLVTRLVRSQMMEVLRTDYVKFARARGLTDRAVNFGHALKNTLIPVITIIGLQLGAIIAFAIITETVFQWPGMGLLFIQSVQNADIPVMSAYLLLVAFLFVLINFVVDMLYVYVDPRIRITGREV